MRGASLKAKGKIYRACVQRVLVYGSETWPMKVNDMQRLVRTENNMVRWMSGVTLKDRRSSEELRRGLGIGCVDRVVRRGRFRWFGHVERKEADDWVSNFLHLETQSSASLRSTCPNHLNLPRLTTLSTHPIPSPRLSSSLDLLSFRVTPDIHLTMLFSVLTSLCISFTFIGQVSLPYTSTLCTHALYIFPFAFNEAPLIVNNLLRSLNFPQAHFTLPLDASSAPPHFPITSPK